MRPLLALLLPWAALLGGCGDDSSSPGPGVDAGETLTAQFALGDRLLEAGDARACAPPAVPAEAAGWPRRWVDAAAAPGGTGAEDAPFATLAEAVAASDDAPLVVLLAAGTYAAGVEPTGPLAVLGPCAARTRLEAPADAAGVRAFGTGSLHLEGVHLTGGALGVDAARLDRVVLRGVRLTASAQAAVRLREVGAAHLEASVIRDQGGRGVVALDSAIAIDGSLIGPGVEVGVLGAFDPARADAPGCASRPSPVCPLSSAVVVRRSLVQGARLRGVDVEAGLAWLTESLVDGVEPVDGEAVGVRLGRSWFALDADFAVRGTAGLGLSLESSRGVAQAIEVAGNARGGVAISRAAAAPEAGAPAWPLGHLPAEAPFNRPPAVAFPGWEWLPRPDAELPPALRRDQALAPGQSWPRIRLQDARLEDNGVFGLRAGDHVVEVEGGVIRGTRGADSAALVLGQIADRPAADPAADLVALSSVRGLRLEENAGLGLVVSRAALFTAEGPWTAARVQLDQLVVRRSAGIGLAVLEGMADVAGATLEGNGGVGLWLAGSFARVRDVAVADTAQAEVPGRDGPIEAGDGLVVQGTERFPGATVEVTDTTVTGSARAGLLVVADEPGRAFSGALRFAPAAVQGNAEDGVILGANPNLVVDGVPLAERDAAEVPPPALPLPGLED